MARGCRGPPRRCRRPRDDGAGRQELQQSQGVGDVADLGGGAVGDPGQIHPLVGGEEKIEEEVELSVLRVVEAPIGLRNQLVDVFAICNLQFAICDWGLAIIRRGCG